MKSTEGSAILSIPTFTKMPDLPEEFRGAGSFAFLRVSGSEAAAPELVRRLCESLQASMADAESARRLKGDAAWI